jgi:hypothetical protein
MPAARYPDLVELRRSLRIPPYKTMADVGFDGPWVTPYQISSRAPDGPAIVALHWLDEPSIDEHRPVLLKLGYLPHLRFNRVLDIALAKRGLSRSLIYVTQAFHLVPTERSENIPVRLIDRSFEAVTRQELADRKVLALGSAAARACAKHGVPHTAVCHPSRRGYSDEQNGEAVAAGLAALGF